MGQILTKEALHNRSNGKLQLNKQLQKSQLNPQLHDDDLIRLHGRFDNTDLPEEAIHPILLPKQETFVTLLSNHFHQKLFHAGVSHTLAQIRNKYWITQGRNEVKRTLRRCLVCKKHQGGPYKLPVMSPWPKSKVTKSPPSTHWVAFTQK